jgi:hypothetical protein
MKRRPITRLAPVLLVGLLLTGCTSGSSGQYAPPPTTYTPATATATPVPTYVKPDSPITSLELASGESRTITFNSTSVGFRVSVTCPALEGESISIKAVIQGATSTAAGTCSTDPRAILQLTIPNAVDGVGVPVKLTLNFTGAPNTRAKVNVLNGADGD